MDTGIPHNIERMNHDEWYFGVLLTSGDTIACSHITFYELLGIKWADIECGEHCHKDTKDYNFGLGKLRHCGNSRRIMTVQIIHIIAIYELTDT